MDEFESLLYDNARSLIDEKFAFALSNMPACEYGPATPTP